VLTPRINLARRHFDSRFIMTNTSGRISGRAHNDRRHGQPHLVEPQVADAEGRQYVGEVAGPPPVSR